MTFKDLPYPPTVNTYWRHVDGKTLLSAKARQYRKDACYLIQLQMGVDAKTFDRSIAMTIVAYMPDRRKRDLDNILKPILDVFTHAGVYLDDSQIDYLTIRRGPVKASGTLTVTIQEMQR